VIFFHTESLSQKINTQTYILEMVPFLLAGQLDSDVALCCVAVFWCITKLGFMSQIISWLCCLDSCVHFTDGQ
jgi:hypothetical protein